jgi:DNA-binding MarR family transcriptional regulator
MIVDKLVRKGIVSREHSSTDRRVVMIKLTADGEQAYKTIHEDIMRMGRTMLESLSEHEQDMLLDLYRKIGSKFS